MYKIVDFTAILDIGVLNKAKFSKKLCFGIFFIISNKLLKEGHNMIIKWFVPSCRVDCLEKNIKNCLALSGVTQIKLIFVNHVS